MDKKEVVEILKTISTFYGGKFKLDDPQSTVNAWHMVLQDYEFEHILQNLQSYVKCNRFPPAVADVIGIEQPKDRAIPSYDETKSMITKWDRERENAASPDVARKHLEHMREILGLRG